MVVHLQSNATLGRLSRVDVREVWSSEAVGFTPWLAQEENLQLLAETINMQLVLEAKEKHVGVFRADILARDVQTGHLVLIENQLERTDHGHLGQLLTYAAGLKAVSIVWVSTLFTEEHRAALDWLNEITSSSIAFFGLEMELWRIDDSAIAPKFNLVSKPNMFSKRVSELMREPVGVRVSLFIQEQAALGRKPSLTDNRSSDGHVHVVASNRNRKARKKLVLGSHTPAQIRDMLQRHHYHCYFCRAKLRKDSKKSYGYDFHVEHTFPLSRVAGTDIPANNISYLVPACPTCNSKKKDKFPWEWAEGGRLL